MRTADGERVIGSWQAGTAAEGTPPERAPEVAPAQDVLDLLAAWGWEKGLEKAWERPWGRCPRPYPQGPSRTFSLADVRPEEVEKEGDGGGLGMVGVVVGMGGVPGYAVG